MTDVTAGRLLVSDQAGALVLAVEGPLDGRCGDLLVAAVAGTQGTAGAVEIDLGAVTSYTEAGIAALGRCHALARRLPCRLSYRAGSQLGRALLLEAARAPD